ncbi:hypothetical protein A6R68_09133, partial [Neotoma lepida]
MCSINVDYQQRLLGHRSKDNASASEGRDETSTEPQQPVTLHGTELVDQLYSFRDSYFETHSVEDAGRKQQDVQDEMEKTLQQMEEVLGSVQGEAQALMLKGKALNVTPEYSPKAEALLSKANPKISQQALSAYAQALHKYEESYGEALEGFSQAAALDPAWPEPRQREQQLLEFLTRLSSLLESKGKTKPKKLQSMLGNLRPAQLGPCGDGRYQSASGQKVTLELKPLSALQPGVNSGAVVLGKVVFSLTTEEKVPFVRVETPLLLVVNGKPQHSNSQATATVASRP